MPLESCMILLDCSEYMRNGDYIPTRMEAQIDAANLLVGAKTQSHPESTVGVSAGTELLVSPTDDVGKILSALHGLHLKSTSDNVTSAVQVASLALKHRRNKNGSQRIVLFVGTPLKVETKALQKAGRQLKKNNVAIDVVAMGELETNEGKLQELVEAAGSAERTCHLVTIPPGVLPSDVLASSPILAGTGGALTAAAMAGGDNFADFGGVDPNLDPELAMALRFSMEEERARQERMAQQEAAAAQAQEAPALSEEDALLQQALAMSFNEVEPPKQEEMKDVEMEDDEDAAMQMALQMSMQNEEATQDFQDPNFVSQLLGSMEGVDPDDPEIQEALKKAQKKKDDDDKKGEQK